MGYSAISFSAGEQPTTAKWNILGTNDSSFNDGTGIADSAILPRHLFTGTGTSWVTQNWVPTWVNLTVGNGTVTAKYAQIGKTVFFRLCLVVGSSTVVGSVPNFTLPVNSVTYTGTALNQILGPARLMHSSTVFNGVTAWRSTTTAQMQIMTATGGAGTGIGQVDITGTVPWTWAAADEMVTQGFYEAT